MNKLVDELDKKMSCKILNEININNKLYKECYINDDKEYISNQNVQYKGTKLSKKIKDENDSNSDTNISIDRNNFNNFKSNFINNKYINDYETPENHELMLLYNKITNNYTIFLNYPKYTKYNLFNNNNYAKSDIYLFPINNNISSVLSSEFVVLFKVYKNVPLCITDPLNDNGFIRTLAFLKANLIWKLLKTDKMDIFIKKLNCYQRYNHFPCTWQIGRKDNLWRNYKIFKEKYGKEHFDYMPYTYLIPEDSENFINEVYKYLNPNSKRINQIQADNISPSNTNKFDVIKEENYLIDKEINKLKKNKLYIIKPVASSRGRGIKLLTPGINVPKKCLISSYIFNPHLINNKKYDLRIYVVITNFNPLKIYVYKEGLVRFASENYDALNHYNKYMHLTNYSLNKESENYDKDVCCFSECKGNKWGFSALKKYFEINEKVSFEDVWSDIRDVIVKSVITIEDQTNKKIRDLYKLSTSNKVNLNNNCMYELYGYDVLLDSNFKPWLMEVNLNPSLNTDTELDLKLKSMLMTDIFNLIGIEPFLRIGLKKNTQINYNNIEEKNKKLTYGTSLNNKLFKNKIKKDKLNNTNMYSIKNSNFREDNINNILLLKDDNVFNENTPSTISDSNNIFLNEIEYINYSNSY